KLTTFTVNYSIFSNFSNGLTFMFFQVSD
ncbi:uncharacterized protein METZ01_LOCUS350462, partial [marine metagenome]